jgi:uncharacterized protein (TIGR04222 family)
MNPLDWSGPRFLLLYVPLLVLTFIGAAVLRGMRRPPGGVPTPAALDLPPYLVALLVGRGAALQAALASLVHSGALTLENGVPFLGTALPKGAHPLEDALYTAVSQGVRDAGGLKRAVEPVLLREEEALRRRGLLVDPQELKRLHGQAFLPVAGVLALGVAKVGVGLSRDKPVGMLVFLLLMAAIASVVVWSGGAFRLSRRGDAALAALRRTHKALRMSAGSEGAARLLTPGHLALAVGLYGTAALASSQFGPLRDFLQPALGGTGWSGADVGYGDIDTRNSYDSMDSGGGGDSGGGDGGGGDSGGGGCGGCGGGGGD